MNADWARFLLYSNLVAHTVLIAGALWCIAFPRSRGFSKAERSTLPEPPCLDQGNRPTFRTS